MIDYARLAALRDRFDALKSDYARAGDELRAFAKQCTREHADLRAAVVGSVTTERIRRYPDQARLEPEQFATDPAVVDKVSSMSYDELEAAGASPAQINSLRARDIVLARKRRAHEQLGARVRTWASYMESIERLAAEHGA